MKLPLFLRRYFWDTDFGTLNPGKNSSYVIVRLLEQGNVQAIQRLAKEVSANFWSLILHLHKTQIKGVTGLTNHGRDPGAFLSGWRNRPGSAVRPSLFHCSDEDAKREPLPQMMKPVRLRGVKDFFLGEHKAAKEILKIV